MLLRKLKVRVMKNKIGKGAMLDKARSGGASGGLIFLLIILVIIVAVSVALYMSLRTDVIEAQVSSDQVLRMLFVIDRPLAPKNQKATLESDEGGQATDTGERAIIASCVLVYYPESHKALVINVPNITGGIWQSIGKVDKIEAVFTKRGIASYKSEVETLLGIQIPFTALIHNDDFVELVDLLGGLRVFIPAPIDSTNSDGERYLLPSGAVNLDGDKIITYLKHTQADDTFSDIEERKQDVLASFFSMMRERQGVYFSKKKIFKGFVDKITVNLKHFDDIFNLFAILAQLDGESIGRLTVTGRLRNVDGELLLFPMNNGDFIKEAVKQSINMLLSNSGASASRIYVLEIKNGTRKQGLAHNTSILFQNASYDVLATSNADKEFDKTTIIDHIGNPEMAKMVGDFIHCDNITEEEISEESLADSVADVDFTIILGKDFDGRYVR